MIYLNVSNQSLCKSTTITPTVFWQLKLVWFKPIRDLSVLQCSRETSHLGCFEGSSISYSSADESLYLYRACFTSSAFKVQHGFSLYVNILVPLKGCQISFKQCLMTIYSQTYRRYDWITSILTLTYLMILSEDLFFYFSMISNGNYRSLLEKDIGDNDILGE